MNSVMAMRLASSLLLMAALFPSEAEGQGRPYRSLFGGAATDATNPRSLTASVSLAGGYDDDVLAETGAVGRPDPARVAGVFSAVAGDLSFIIMGERTQLQIGLGSQLRHFAEVNEVVPVGSHFTGAFSRQLTRTTTVGVQQAIAYTPSYLYGLLASLAAPAVGETFPSGADYVIDDLRAYSLSTGANITQRVGRRGAASMRAGFRKIAFLADEGDVDTLGLTSWELGGAFTYGFTRDATLRLGYVRRHAEYASALRPVQHDLDIGVDYRRALSRSRRTYLGISTGAALMETPSELPSGEEQVVRQYSPLARVSLSHHMGRTWTAMATYQRQGRFIEGLRTPVFTDGVTLGVRGFLSRRVDASASAAYSKGKQIGLQASDFASYTGSLRFRFALTRQTAAFAEYLAYFYDFAAGARLPSSAPAKLRRNGIRVGLTFWMPVWRG